MAIDASQIGLWLRAARERKGAGAQPVAAVKAGVGADMLAKAEQGRDHLVTRFLALVEFYEAEDFLAQQIKEWRAGNLLSSDFRRPPAKAGAAAKFKGPIPRSEKRKTK